MSQSTNTSKEIMRGTWDGRFSFGYSAAVSPQTGTILGFTQVDSDSPSGVPHYVGIFSSVTHDSASQTAATGPFAFVGLAGANTQTGLTGKIQAGFVGGVASTLTTATGQIFAGFVSAMSPSGNTFIEPATKDVTFPKSTHFKASADHITGYWSQVLNSSSSTGYGTTYPGIVSSARFCIQDYGAPVTDAANTTEYWSIYGENVNGSLATFPAVTGYLRMTYPRRTGRTGVRAMHAWWEPWPNTATIRGGAVSGDTYFDDGTNFPAGLWEFSKTAAGGAAAWNFLLSSPGVNALGGGAAPTLGTIGGAGPATAAQANWVKINCADGVVRWVPAWV